MRSDHRVWERTACSGFICLVLFGAFFHGPLYAEGLDVIAIKFVLCMALAVPIFFAWKQLS
jgi:hypothetical protein